MWAAEGALVYYIYIFTYIYVCIHAYVVKLLSGLSLPFEGLLSGPSLSLFLAWFQTVLCTFSYDLGFFLPNYQATFKKSFFKSNIF